MDDKAYLRQETSEGARGARKQTILQPSDETRARSLPVRDFPEASVYVTPFAFRFIRKKTEVVEEEVTLVTKTDNSIVVVEPKAYVPTHASTWASNSMRLGGKGQVSTNRKSCIGNTRKNVVAYVFECMTVRITSIRQQRLIFCLSLGLTNNALTGSTKSCACIV